jgi:outer membrane protein assembly factor BamB
VNMRTRVSVALTFCVGLGVATASADDQAGAILRATGVKGGLIVHVGCGDPSTGSGQAGKLTAALRAGDGCLVHGLDADATNVAAARAHIQSRGLYGPVSVDTFDGQRLPYADNLVRLVVADDLGKLSMNEVLRVLAPNGVAYIGGTKTVKPRPSNIDEWTHFLHDATNNAVAHDTVVGPPRRMQWVASPLYARSHEIDSSMSALVSSGGRIFYIYDEGLIGITDQRLPAQWSLLARDAFSGVLLWKQPMPLWGWREWKKSTLEGKDWTKLSGQRGRFPSSLARRLVAVGDRVYVTLAYAAPLSILDAATGKVIRTCKGTEGTDEILCSDGVVVVRVRDIQGSQTQRRTGKAPPERLMGLDAKTGNVLWTETSDKVQSGTMAAAGGCLVYVNSKNLICRDLKTGRGRWHTARKGGGTLVARADVVLIRSGNTFEAFAMKDGKRLWKKSLTGAGGALRADLLVANGLVWQGVTTPGLIKDASKYWDQPFKKPRSPQTGVTMVGVDPVTGEQRKKIEIANAVTPGHHFRCYRSKATDRYILWPKRAIEFIDLKGDDHTRNDWVRGICRYGVMPANGLLYVPPNQCFCYTGADVGGFKSLAAAANAPAKADNAPLFEKGPAYGAIRNPNSEIRNGEWATFRGDAKRSGAAATKVPTKVGQLWQTELGGKITQPVVSGGRLYIASVDTHTVHALDAGSGRKVWSFTAGGRVDSPPTIHGGLALFGSADGWVYCVRADDGALAWRFRAAPQRRRIVAFGQVESVWPVHGSVLVKDGIAYASAGRSSYLDGGIRVVALDPATGSLLHQTCIDGPHLGKKDIGEPFSADGTFSDVLVTDGTYLYMQQVMMDAKLKQITPKQLTNMGDKKFGRHVFSTAGFLNDAWWNRTIWMHTERYPGFYLAQQSPKTGQLVVHDAKTTYGVKCYTTRNVHSPMFFPATDGYLLVADDNDTEPILTGDPGDPKAIKWLPTQHSRRELQLAYKAVDFDKGVGFARSTPPKWSAWIPVRARAMVIAGETLVIAGPPDVLDAKDPLAAFEGRAGGVLWTISAKDGKKIAECKLASPPVFDGMIAANGKLYLATRDGKIACMGEAK